MIHYDTSNIQKKLSHDDTDMMMSDVKLHHLRYFVMVAEEKHFGKAARRLGIAQPPLSQQIQRLEKTIGHSLFVRRPTVELTPAGEALLANARSTLDQVEAAVEAARRAGRGETGGLSLTYAISTTLSRLPSAIRAFAQRYPDVALRLIELSSGRQLQTLKSGAVDLAFLREPPDDPELRRELTIREGFVAALPPNHRMAKRSGFDLREVADEPFIHFPRREAPGLYDRMEDLFREHGFRPRVVQETTEWLTILALVEARLGISVVPTSFRKLQWGNLAYVDLQGTQVKTTIGLCLRPGVPNPAVENFVRVAREVFTN